jgi:hypothetical protein
VPIDAPSILHAAEPFELPYDLLAYEQWLRERGQSPSRESYLFLEPRVRFSPEPDDRLCLVKGATARREGKRVSITHNATGAKVFVEGLELSLVERILSAIDGTHSLLAAQLTAQASSHEFDTFLRATFGTFVLCPNTMSAFESQVSASTLVRFPGSPYEVDRGYWSNMIDVRHDWESTGNALNHVHEFAQFLKRLHVVSLIGRSGRSFYRPSSPIVSKSGARAGVFYDVPTKTLQELGMTLFIDGPRVSAPFVGGQRYHELLARSLQDPGALLQDREIRDENGVSWGKVTVGQARHDSAKEAWFIPPRPILPIHLDTLYALYKSTLHSERVEPNERLRSIARFHYFFVRLHPFACANQSLSMNLVNGLLERADHTGLPHLILDQLALRLSPEAYTHVFERVTRAWSTRPCTTPEERLARLLARRKEMDILVGAIAQAKDLDEAKQRVHDAPNAARSALLTDD